MKNICMHAFCCLFLSAALAHAAPATDTFNKEIKQLADSVGRAIHTSGQKRVVFGRLFFNGGKATPASTFIKRKVVKHLLNDARIELFDRDDIATKFEEDKLVFALQGKGIPELSSTHILLTGEIIALQDKKGVFVSLRLIDMVTGELLAAPVSLLPVTDALSSRLKTKADPLSPPLTAPIPEIKGWVNEMKAKLPNAKAKVTFADLPSCPDSQRLQLRLVRAFLLQEMKLANVRILEREFLYLTGGDPLAQDDALSGFLQGDALFSINPDSSENADVFNCSARLTSSTGRLLYVTEFKFDYVSGSGETTGSLAEASLEDALKQITQDAKAGKGDKLIYTRTWTLAGGCPITKEDVENYKVLGRYIPIWYVSARSFDLENLHRDEYITNMTLPKKKLAWSPVMREMIRRLALAHESNTKLVQASVLTCILNGFGFSGRDEEPWGEFKWPGLWNLVLMDANNDWTLSSDGKDNNIPGLSSEFWNYNFSEKFLVQRTGFETRRFDDLPKLTFPKGQYILGQDSKNPKNPFVINYEFTWKWKGLMPSEVSITIDLTPMKSKLYKVKK